MSVKLASEEFLQERREGDFQNLRVRLKNQVRGILAFGSRGLSIGCSSSVVFSVTLVLMKLDSLWAGRAGEGACGSISKSVLACISRRLNFKPTKKIVNCQPAMQIQNAAARYTDQFATVP